MESQGVHLLLRGGVGHSVGGVLVPGSGGAQEEPLQKESSGTEAPAEGHFVARILQGRQWVWLMQVGWSQLICTLETGRTLALAIVEGTYSVILSPFRDGWM